MMKKVSLILLSLFMINFVVASSISVGFSVMDDAGSNTINNVVVTESGNSPFGFILVVVLVIAFFAFLKFGLGKKKLAKKTAKKTRKATSKSKAKK